MVKSCGSSDLTRPVTDLAMMSALGESKNCTSTSPLMDLTDADKGVPRKDVRPLPVKISMRAFCGNLTVTLTAAMGSVGLRTILMPSRWLVLSMTTGERANGTNGTGERDGGRGLCLVPDVWHSTKIQSLPSAARSALGEVWNFAECRTSGTRRNFEVISQFDDPLDSKT